MQISSHDTTPTPSVSTLRRYCRLTLEEDVGDGLDILSVDIKTGGTSNVHGILLAISITAAPIVEEYPNHSIVQEQVGRSADFLEEGHAACGIIGGTV
jgi:hypothetical protein